MAENMYMHDMDEGGSGVLGELLGCTQYQNYHRTIELNISMLT
jgi:hypothetical protein